MQKKKIIIIMGREDPVKDLFLLRRLGTYFLYFHPYRMRLS